MFSEWQFAQNDATCSLPGPSGRFTGGPPRPPRTWASRCNEVMNNAAPIDSESSVFVHDRFTLSFRSEPRKLHVMTHSIDEDPAPYTSERLSSKLSSTSKPRSIARELSIAQGQPRTMRSMRSSRCQRMRFAYVWRRDPLERRSHLARGHREPGYVDPAAIAGAQRMATRWHGSTPLWRCVERRSRSARRDRPGRSHPRRSAAHG